MADELDAESGFLPFSRFDRKLGAAAGRLLV